MAESADILTADHQAVILPDLNAGCSMADMADIDEVEEAWEALAAVIDVERVVPITYMNSSAALKAFVGRHGGAVCTSTNARAVLEWALGGGARGARRPGRQGAVLPRPAPRPQHRRGHGLRARRHAGVGPPPRPRRPHRGATCKEATFLLWRGHCSIHQRFRPEHVAAFRAEHPDGIVVVHPEVPARDRARWPTRSGSTDYIIRALADAPRRVDDRGRAPRSTWSTGWPRSTPTRPSCRSTR